MAKSRKVYAFDIFYMQLVYQFTSAYMCEKLLSSATPPPPSPSEWSFVVTSLLMVVALQKSGMNRKSRLAAH
jgi:hypothetical protein